jgi:hypothetical protein
MYFVTTIKDINKDCIQNSNNIRTVGFYSKFEDAEYTVLNNVCDINELMYDYVVIERIDEGLYPYSEEAFLYNFNYDTRQYMPIPLDKIPLNVTFVQVG